MLHMNKTIIHPSLEALMLLAHFQPSLTKDQPAKLGLVRNSKEKKITGQSIMESSMSIERVTNSFAKVRTRSAVSCLLLVYVQCLVNSESMIPNDQARVTSFIGP